MKLRLALVLFACALGGCKDKQSSTTPAPDTATPTACMTTAVHATKLMQSELGDVLAEADWPKVTALLDRRCTEDQWSADVRGCMDAALGERDFDACADQLTAEQNAAVKEQFEQEIAPLMREDAMKKKDEASDRGAPTGAPAPASAPPPDQNDPCGGGE